MRSLWLRVRNAGPAERRRYFRLTGEIAWVAAGQGTAVLGSLVGLRVLTEYLGAAQFGMLALALTIFTLFGTIVYAGPGQAVMRFFASSMEAGQTDPFMRAAWRSMAWRTAVVAALIGAGVCGAWLSGKTEWLGILAAAGLYSVFSAFSTILDGAQNAVRQRAVVAWHAGLGQWLRFLFALALFPFFGRSAEVALWGYSLGAVVVFASQCLLFRRYRRSLPSHRGEVSEGKEKEWLSRVNAYSWAFVMWGFFFWLHTSSERWALERFVDTEAVGFYAALYQSGFGMMTLGSNVLIQVVAPVMFGRAGDGTDESQVDNARRLGFRILGAFLVVTFLVSGLVALIHRPLFALLVAPKFRSVSGLLPVLVLSGGFYSCTQLAAYYILSGKSSDPLIVPTIGSSVTGTLLTIAAARYWGLAGVVGASLVSSTVYLLWVIRASPGAGMQLLRLAVSPIVDSRPGNRDDKSRQRPY